MDIKVPIHPSTSGKLDCTPLTSEDRNYLTCVTSVQGMAELLRTVLLKKIERQNCQQPCINFGCAPYNQIHGAKERMMCVIEKEYPHVAWKQLSDKYNELLQTLKNKKLTQEEKARLTPFAKEWLEREAKENEKQEEEKKYGGEIELAAGVSGSGSEQKGADETQQRQASTRRSRRSSSEDSEEEKVKCDARIKKILTTFGTTIQMYENRDEKDPNEKKSFEQQFALEQERYDNEFKELEGRDSYQEEVESSLQTLISSATLREQRLASLQELLKKLEEEKAKPGEEAKELAECRAESVEQRARISLQQRQLDTCQPSRAISSSSTEIQRLQTLLDKQKADVDASEAEQARLKDQLASTVRDWHAKQDEIDNLLQVITAFEGDEKSFQNGLPTADQRKIDKRVKQLVDYFKKRVSQCQQEQAESKRAQDVYTARIGAVDQAYQERIKLWQERADKLERDIKAERQVIEEAKTAEKELLQTALTKIHNDPDRAAVCKYLQDKFKRLRDIDVSCVEEGGLVYGGQGQAAAVAPISLSSASSLSSSSSASVSQTEKDQQAKNNFDRLSAMFKQFDAEGPTSTFPSVDKRKIATAASSFTNAQLKEMVQFMKNNPNEGREEDREALELIEDLVSQFSDDSPKRKEIETGSFLLLVTSKKANQAKSKERDISKIKLANIIKNDSAAVFQIYTNEELSADKIKNAVGKTIKNNDKVRKNLRESDEVDADFLSATKPELEEQVREEQKGEEGKEEKKRECGGRDDLSDEDLKRARNAQGCSENITYTYACNTSDLHCEMCTRDTKPGRERCNDASLLQEPKPKEKGSKAKWTKKDLPK